MNPANENKTCMTRLSEQRCSNNPEFAPRLLNSESQTYMGSIDPNWKLNLDTQCLSRQFKFKNYYQTMAFANGVAWIAHQQDHHPDMTITYRHCTVHYSTHSVKGLSMNDFICAARIDVLIEND